MSINSPTSQQQAAAPSTSQPAAPNWTEPPWSGFIETTGDALLILEAARRGMIPRVTRRLVDSERKMITSGSVFVFDEDESGIKRWTDGFFWSPSRILGNFLLYRETDKRAVGPRNRADGDQPNTLLVNEQSQAPTHNEHGKNESLSRLKSDGASSNMDRYRERSLVGSLTNSYKFKQDGMMKKTFSLTIGGVSQHLISYYKIEDVEQGRLRTPSSLPELAALDISPEYLDKTHFRNPPKVEVGLDGIPRYVGEADEATAAPSPRAASEEVTPTTPTASNRRTKRFDPYAPTTVNTSVKRPKKLPSPSSAGPYHSPDGPHVNTHQTQYPYGVTGNYYPQLHPGYPHTSPPQPPHAHAQQQSHPHQHPSSHVHAHPHVHPHPHHIYTGGSPFIHPGTPHLTIPQPSAGPSSSGSQSPGSAVSPSPTTQPMYPVFSHPHAHGNPSGGGGGGTGGGGTGSGGAGEGQAQATSGQGYYYSPYTVVPPPWSYSYPPVPALQHPQTTQSGTMTVGGIPTNRSLVAAENGRQGEVSEASQSGEV